MLLHTKVYHTGPCPTRGCNSQADNQKWQLGWCPAPKSTWSTCSTPAGRWRLGRNLLSAQNLRLCPSAEPGISWLGGFQLLGRFLGAIHFHVDSSTISENNAGGFLNPLYYLLQCWVVALSSGPHTLTCTRAPMRCTVHTVQQWDALLVQYCDAKYLVGGKCKAPGLWQSPAASDIGNWQKRAKGQSLGNWQNACTVQFQA